MGRPIQGFSLGHAQCETSYGIYFFFFPLYVVVRMALLLFSLARYSYRFGSIPFYDIFSTTVCYLIGNLIYDIFQWLVWLSSILILRGSSRILPTLAFCCQFLHFMHLLLLDRFPLVNVRSLRQMKRGRFPICIPLSDERDLNLSSYRISSAHVYLSRTGGPSLFSIDSPFICFVAFIHRISSDFRDRTSRSPPEGPLLSVLDFVMMFHGLVLAHVTLFRYLLWKRLFDPTLPPSPRPTGKHPFSFYSAKQSSVFTTAAVYSSDQLDSLRPKLDFSSSAVNVIVDNAANIHIWNNQSDFLEGTLKPYENKNQVMTVGSDALLPSGIGDVKVTWMDDEGIPYEIILRKVLYFPSSPVNVLSVTAFANQLCDDEGTWIQTKRNYSVFSWEFGTRTKTIQHPSSNLPEMSVNHQSSFYASMTSFLRPYYCYFARSGPANSVLLPEVDKDDISFLSVQPIDSSLAHSLSKKSTTYAVGERVRYTRDDHTEIGTLTSVDFDLNKDCPLFNISFGGSRTVQTPKEFISHFDEPDPMELPVTDVQLEAFTRLLPSEDLQKLLSLSAQDPSPLQDEFMRWHFKLNHLPFPSMFQLCRSGYLPKKFLSLRSDQLICPSCILGKQRKRPWRVKGQNKTIRKENETSPGDRVSIDQMVSHQPGIVPRYNGRHTRARITCVTCFKDHVSGLSFSHLQESTDGASTLQGKHAFEKLSSSMEAPVQAYHADNGRFAEKQFRDDVLAQGQSISFCAVGSHHQNGIIERHIGLLTSATRTTLLHAQRNWPEAISSLLWPFAWLETERRFNHLHLDSDGRSPIQKHSGVDVRLDLTTLHPWGCPAYVLDARAQVGQAIPKWDPKSRLGIYVGRSRNHAGTVALILNPATLHVSPQFHVVFDDTFSTVKYLQNGDVPPNWKDLVLHSTEKVLTDADIDQATVTVTENDMLLPAANAPTVLPSDTSDSDDTAVAPLHSPSPTYANLDEMTLRRSPRLKALRENQQHSNESPKHAYFTQFNYLPSLSLTSEQPDPASSTILSKAVFYFENTCRNFDGTLNQLHPMALASKNADNDTFTFRNMLKQKDRAEFIKAMLVEIQAHESRNHWTVHLRSSLPPKAKTILAIWSFKRKRRPDGSITKHKARLCAHGGMQRWGENYWETYAPVVNWLSVRTLLVLSILLPLETRSIDFVLAFPQAKLDVDVYMEVPVGFTVDQSRRYVLKLEKNLYGLKQAAYNWYELLKSGLESRNFKQSKADNCVFFRHDAIILTYVDDCIIFTKEKAIADDIINSLQQGIENFEFTDDGDLLQYLGIAFDRKDNFLTLSQPHLIRRIVEAAELPFTTLPKETPAVKPLLHKDASGLPRKTSWNYRQLVGMLNYLQNTTHPDLSMAVHQTARFCIAPKLSHERAIKRIVKYLIGTSTLGLIFQPDPTKGIEVFVDADFAGSWDRADSANPENVLSRTGFVIMLCGVPVLWASRLQSEIALSTAESEYIALSTALREVIPLMHLLQDLRTVFSIHKYIPCVKCKVFEDNQSAIAMSTSKKFTPRTKHIALKYHHFRKYVADGKIRIEAIGTREQTADILTKPVDSPSFKYLRKKLMGW